MKPEFPVHHARPVPAPSGIAPERAQGRGLGDVARNAVMLVALYLFLHVLLDLALWTTGWPLLLTLQPFGLEFFRIAVLGSPRGLDFVIYIFLFLAAWTFSFAVGRGFHNLSFGACFGIFILAYYFLRATYGSLLDLAAVADPTTVAPAIPHAALYRIVIFKLLREAVLPILAILLIFGAVPGLQARAASARWRATAALRRFGVAVRTSWLVDTMHGLWIFFATVVGYWIFALLFLERLTTGDRSQIWVEMTADQVFLLSFAAGFGEEIVWRAVFITFLLWAVQVHRRTTRTRWTLVVLVLLVQAAFFGLVHAGYGDLAQVVGPALFGLIVGATFLRFGFIPAFLVHFLIDVLAFGFLLTQGGDVMASFLNVLLLSSLIVPVGYFGWRFINWLWDTGELAGRIGGS